MEPTITLRSLADGVASLSFLTGRPDNAMTIRALHELLEATKKIERTPPRVLLLEGGRSFCSGADVVELGSLDVTAYLSLISDELELFHALEDLPCPVIAVLSGLCIGTGAELALACDLRVASESMRFSYPEVRLGFAGPAGRLAKYVGIGVARDILLTGRLVRPGEAKSFGLVTNVAPQAQLHDAALDLASQLASSPVRGVAGTRRQLATVYSGQGYSDADLLRDAETAFLASAKDASAEQLGR